MRKKKKKSEKKSETFYIAFLDLHHEKKKQVFSQIPADLLPKISVKMVTIDIKINLCSIDMHVAQKKACISY